MPGLDWCGKFRPPPVFDIRNFKPVASLHTDYAIQGPSNLRYYVLIHVKVLEKSTLNLSQVNLETAHPNVGLPVWSNAKVIHSTCLLT